MAEVSDCASASEVFEVFFALLKEFGCPVSSIIEAVTIAGKNRNAANIPILFIEKSLSLLSYVLFLIMVNVDCNLPLINITVQKRTLRFNNLY
ncbi:hypothetical protein E5672_07720 [Alteromonas portus]|uniref:Uncharacterized protein n=1 Tax=Alteromonas portus TaxID=2565549 RepID=A0A4U0ZJB0_9ALTE|nr:hypothetical protein E5672_07720 [Alteromonas portus]